MPVRLIYTYNQDYKEGDMKDYEYASEFDLPELIKDSKLDGVGAIVVISASHCRYIIINGVIVHEFPEVPEVPSEGSYTGNW